MAAKATPPKPNTFQEHDSPESNNLLVESHEAQFRAAIGTAATRLLHDLLADATLEPESIQVKPDAFREAMDAVAREVYASVTKDMQRKLASVGHDGVAAKATIAAQEEDMPYEEWATRFNALKAQELADTLRNRLRLRILQFYAAGLAVKDIKRAVADEFSSYLTSQLDTAARTVVMDYFNSARAQTYEAAGSFVKGIKFIPLLDSATTPFCQSLLNRSISKQDPNYARLANPPFWYNCRTTTSPILANEEWSFDTDWTQWLAEHASTDGGGFVYGVS